MRDFILPRVSALTCGIYEADLEESRIHTAFPNDAPASAANQLSRWHGVCQSKLKRTRFPSALQQKLQRSAICICERTCPPFTSSGNAYTTRTSFCFCLSDRFRVCRCDYCFTLKKTHKQFLREGKTGLTGLTGPTVEELTRSLFSRQRRKGKAATSSVSLNKVRQQTINMGKAVQTVAKV